MSQSSLKISQQDYEWVYRKRHIAHCFEEVHVSVNEADLAHKQDLSSYVSDLVEEQK